MTKSTKKEAVTENSDNTKVSWEDKVAKLAAGLVVIVLATYGLHAFLVSQAAKGAKLAIYDGLTAVIMSLLLYVLSR